MFSLSFASQAAVLLLGGVRKVKGSNGDGLMRPAYWRWQAGHPHLSVS